MYRYFGEQPAYDVFNMIAYYVLLVSCLFYYRIKKPALGAGAKSIIHFASRYNTTLCKIITVVLVSVESLILALTLNRATYYNFTFGTLVGTGANYFATLICAPIYWFFISLLLISNPLKQIDVATLFTGPYLFFIKLACFFNGCCGGIPWEYGPYNHFWGNPGRQVPVQAIEAILAIFIYVLLMIYRKKAKPGTMYPMYLILYCFTRFFSEFFRHEENVLGPLKIYHLFCIGGFVIGLILFLIMIKYGEKLSDFFDRAPLKIEQKIALREEQKALAEAEAKAQAEIAEQERLEKVRLAREKAKARRRK